jgi:hypothetical protein
MTSNRSPLGTNRSDDLLRRLDILIGLLAVVATLQGIHVASHVSGPFIPAFLVMLLFGLGVIVLTQSVLN